MKLVWVTRSFLDYRIPVYGELSRLLEGEFRLVFCADAVPESVRRKAAKVLGDRAIGLTGERRLGAKTVVNSEANRVIRIPWQSGLVREIERHAPDVLISDGLFQWSAAAIWLRARKRIPHVMCYERTAHTERHAQWYRRLYRKFVMRWVDAVCCSGSLCGDYTASLGFSRDRMTFGHMVADTHAVSAGVAAVTPDDISGFKERLGLRGALFLYDGRLFRMKGIGE